MFQSVIEAVAHHGENTPEKICVVDETKALTYGEFWVGINEVTEKLKKLGINKEDKVCRRKILLSDRASLDSQPYKSVFRVPWTNADF